jgi:hypothetical protein
MNKKAISTQKRKAEDELSGASVTRQHLRKIATRRLAAESHMKTCKSAWGG